MIKKVFIFLFSLFIGIGLLTWVIRFVGWSEIRSAFLIFAGWHGMIILLLTILMFLINIWKWKTILKSQGHSLSFITLLRPYLAGFSIMYLVPMIVFGGEIFRAYALKTKNLVPAPKAYASVIIDRILELTVYLSVIFLGTVTFFLKIGLPPKNLGIILGGVFIFFASITVFFYFRIFKKESIIKIFVKKMKSNNQIMETEREIFSFFKVGKQAMWKGFALAFLRSAILLLRTWFLVLFLGKSIGFLSALSISGFYYLAFMIPIPTALGIHEAIQAFVFNALGWGASLGTAFTMIVRGAELIVALAGLIFLFRLGINLLEVNLLRRIEKFTQK